MMSRHFRLRSKPIGAKAKILSRAKHQLSSVARLEDGKVSARGVLQMPRLTMINYEVHR